MTALNEYQRLESPGLWRANNDAQRVDVIVSLGKATLTISDATDRALAHWSLPAIIRLNPGQRPALYSPSIDAADTLELEDQALIGALEKLHAIIEKRKPRKGRLRHFVTFSLSAFIGLGAVFWLPNALATYTVNVVPEATRAALGQRLAIRIHRVAGRACLEPFGARALQVLGQNLLGSSTTQLIVLAQASRPAMHLPGQVILLNHALIEAYDSPNVVAGFILAETARAQETDPMLALLRHAGVMATVTLLTTGDLRDSVLDSYSEAVMTGDVAAISNSALLAKFATAQVPASPYAFAMDPTGEATLELIEADPVPLSQAKSLLTDGEWISLQGICTE